MFSPCSADDPFCQVSMLFCQNLGDRFEKRFWWILGCSVSCCLMQGVASDANKAAPEPRAWPPESRRPVIEMGWLALAGSSLFLLRARVVWGWRWCKITQEHLVYHFIFCHSFQGMQEEVYSDFGSDSNKLLTQLFFALGPARMMPLTQLG